MADEAQVPSMLVCVGRVDDLARPGAFFTQDAAGVPLLVTRDEAGGVHVLVNRCRHRGAPVVEAASGTATGLAAFTGPSLPCR